MVTSKELPKLPAIGAQQLESKIDLLYSEAFADAALHDATGEIDQKQNDFDASHVDDVLADPKEKQRALKDMTTYAALKFDASQEDDFLQAAFNNLKALVRARAMDETAPGQRNFLVQEAIDKYEDHLKTLNEKIEKGELPEENRKSFTEAFGHATTATISTEWDKMATRRSRQGFREV